MLKILILLLVIVEFAFDKLLKEDGVVPNVVFVDPPRRGLDDVTIENLNKLKLDKDCVY